VAASLFASANFLITTAIGAEGAFGPRKRGCVPYFLQVVIGREDRFTVPESEGPSTCGALRAAQGAAASLLAACRLPLAGKLLRLGDLLAGHEGR
jgi:hypothetical protein